MPAREMTQPGTTVQLPAGAGIQLTAGGPPEPR
jgi:hypothetical protein